MTNHVIWDRSSGLQAGSQRPDCKTSLGPQTVPGRIAERGVVRCAAGEPPKPARPHTATRKLNTSKGLASRTLIPDGDRLAARIQEGDRRTRAAAGLLAGEQAREGPEGTREVLAQVALDGVNAGHAYHDGPAEWPAERGPTTGASNDHEERQVCSGWAKGLTSPAADEGVPARTAKTRPKSICFLAWVVWDTRLRAKTRPCISSSGRARVLQRGQPIPARSATSAGKSAGNRRTGAQKNAGGLQA